jgi:predicted methyltransferase MtxX (methanogen marker protein 4)
MIEQFDVRVRRLALLGTVGIDEGESMSDRLELLLGRARFMPGMGVRPKGPVLSGGRMESRGPGARAWTESLAEGELIAAPAQEAGLQARHKRRLIEGCREGANHYRAGWVFRQPHLPHAITIMRRIVLRRAGAA